MKLISLNLWGGRVYNKLLPFLKEMAKEIDIFCFQEVLAKDHYISHEAAELKKRHSGVELEEVPDLYSELKSTLIGFESFLASPLGSGGERQAIFFKQHVLINENGIYPTVSKPFEVKLENEIFSLSSAIQYVKIKPNLTIMNIHGLWQGGGKEDTPERMYQSQRIVEFLSATNGKKVLVGDFNLLPDTRSIRAIEDAGMLNLIRINNIQSTRSSFYARASKGKFADYAFVSKDVKVEEFRVLQDEISDHLPLYLNFS